MVWKRRGLRTFIVLFLMLQLTLPVIGLTVRDAQYDQFPFSWHMFSRVPTGDAE